MTCHSIMRAVERTNLKTDAAIRMIKRAKEHGKRSAVFPAEERKYLSRMERDGNKAIFYSGYCFILSPDDTCITLFPVPQWFGKKYKFDGKTEIRNAKKYLRMWRNEYDSKREIQQYCL